VTPRELVALWRQDADVFDRHQDTRTAALLRSHADAIEAALRSQDDDALDLATAAMLSGYSTDRLRHMVAAGDVPNAGKKGAPRIRRGDLPIKPGRARGGFDATLAASEVLQLSAPRTANGPR
jgi:hypothetical protein